MANDDKASAGLTNRQKAIAAIFVVVVIVIVWQVYGLFGGGGGTSAPQPAKMAAVTPKPMQPGSPAAAGGQPPAQPGVGMPSAGAPNAMPAPAANGAAQLLQQTNVLTIPNDVNTLQNQQQEQKKYLDELNSLQLLKVQQQVAETSQAIASAKLATATAEKGISDLLTKPAVPTLPVGAYANSLVSPVQSGSQLAAIPVPQAIPEANYVVISVSMQFNKWTAVLGLQGKFLIVNIGDQLPDGSAVLGINKSGVVIERNAVKRKLSILNSI